MANPQNDQSTLARKVALNILLAVVKDGQSLSSLTQLTENIQPRDAAFARMLSFGVLRFYFQLQNLLNPLMKKKLRAKDADVELVILLALYQILYTRVPEYAAVDAAVKQIRKSKKKWAASMVNAVLRSFLRQIEKTSFETLLENTEDEVTQYAHPQWMISRVKKDWPENWVQILQANNQQAPMTLRVNLQKISRQEYASRLENDYELSADVVDGLPSALILQQPRDVKQLPGFDQGEFSVQDAGAQLAAQILNPQAGDVILDACAAPGGKTAHLFEIQKNIKVTALDISEKRLKRVEENCRRLGFNATLVAADAINVDEWWQGEKFDKILLDVPCSALGVIRRHPDIKLLRWDDDIENLVEIQRKILTNNWALLKPGGQLLYVTCSVLKSENQQQIEWFLKHTDDVKLLELACSIKQMSGSNSSQQSVGLQLFPLDGVHDGFYYALLEKTQ